MSLIVQSRDPFTQTQVDHKQFFEDLSKPNFNHPFLIDLVSKGPDEVALTILEFNASMFNPFRYFTKSLSAERQLLTAHNLFQIINHYKREIENNEKNDVEVMVQTLERIRKKMISGLPKDKNEEISQYFKDTICKLVEGAPSQQRSEKLAKGPEIKKEVSNFIADKKIQEEGENSWRGRFCIATKKIGGFYWKTMKFFFSQEIFNERYQKPFLG